MYDTTSPLPYGGTQSIIWINTGLVIEHFVPRQAQTWDLLQKPAGFLEVRAPGE